VHVERGGYVFRTGEVARYGYVLGAGKVGMGRPTTAGRRRLMTLFLPGDPFGLTSVFDGTPRAVDAVALNEGVSFAFPAAALREWVLGDARRCRRSGTDRTPARR
jgi:CRP-like cAMP-binding protein